MFQQKKKCFKSSLTTLKNVTRHYVPAKLQETLRNAVNSVFLHQIAMLLNNEQHIKQL